MYIYKCIVLGNFVASKPSLLLILLLVESTGMAGLASSFDFSFKVVARGILFLGASASCMVE